MTKADDIQRLVERIEGAIPHAQAISRIKGPDYEMIIADGFTMVTQHPTEIVGLFETLPEILAALRARITERTDDE